jgi:CubicO group peptidase (beta-lactamase class C family)
MESLDNPLIEILKKYSDVPSLASAVILGDEIKAAGAVGYRKRGFDERVQLTDKYHIGSCGKSMTATLAAILIEKGYLKWETRIENCFSDVELHKGYKNVELRHLLTHMAGCPTNPNDVLWDEMWNKTIPPSSHRTKLTRSILSEEPHHRPVEIFEYSNVGFIIAGTVLETVMNDSFENLLTKFLFEPLQLTSFGFGAPPNNGKIEQPYGHDPEPVDPEPEGDNPPATSPAGTVHLSILDFARYVSFHLSQKPKDILGNSTFNTLHTPVNPDKDYAMGWNIVERDWAEGAALTHSGSNTTFFATMWVAPKRDFAAVAACNIGTENGFDVCNEAIGNAVKKYLK